MPRRSHSDVFALQRLLTLLTLIPRGAPQGRTVAELYEALEGIRRRHRWDSVSTRTVQRDLVDLSFAFPGLRRDDARPNRWYWSKEASAPLGVPMTAAQALAFTMARDHLAQVLPKSVVADLEPFFEAAQKSLGDFPKQARWGEKLRVEGLGFHAAPPTIRPEVAAAVTDALLRERRCGVRYRKGHGKEESAFVVDPLGLLARNGTLTLVCTKVEHADEGPRQLHLHRMSAAWCLDEMRQVPRGFRLADYDIGGGPGIAVVKSMKTIALKLAVEPGAPFWPDERPLPKQTLGKTDDGRLLVEARVPNSREFVAWLRGFGPGVEVLEPASLREQLAGEARQVWERHGGR